MTASISRPAALSATEARVADLGMHGLLALVPALPADRGTVLVSPEAAPR
jgi:hypothetical protein